MGNNIKELVGKRLFVLRGDSTLEEIAANLNKRLGYNSFTKQKLSKVEKGGQEVNYEDLIATLFQLITSWDCLKRDCRNQWGLLNTQGLQLRLRIIYTRCTLQTKQGQKSQQLRCAR